MDTCVMADATQMHQIIMNLCTNAYHAMEEKGGLLTVKLGRHTPEAGQPDTPSDLWGVPCLEMTISDTGSGMDEDTLARIFDPYFTTKPQGKGTGLGLAVVHGIVESHGGSIQVESSPNEGTTFRLRFPEVVAQAKPENEIIVLHQAKGERVLLVDDEASIIDMGSEMLTTLGYVVTAFENPQEALDNFRQSPHSVDLVITDLAMPNLKGDDLAKALHEIRCDLPVILCSGFNGPEMGCPEADTLFSAQLPKPFTAEDLQKAIQTALASCKEL
jgi:CheY-like chemotaxis protein